jgi:tripartite-type tricarboxylate transporter receptor subunit TctC
MHLLQRCTLLLLVTAGAIGAPLPGHAQAYPEHPIRMVVPYPPGGGTDVIACVVQGKLQAALGQTVNVELVKWAKLAKHASIKAE